MILRRFTSQGLDAFGDWLAQVQREGKGEPPSELLQGWTYARNIEPRMEAEDRVFDTRFEWASYAYELLRPLDQNLLDREFWAWMSLALFDSVCPKDRNGNRKVGARARYIPEGSDYRRYYRHLLASPYAIYRAYARHPFKALCLLSSSLSAPGELVEQLASRQELVQNETVIDAATRLYIDSNGGAKRGSGGSGPGSPRRLAQVVAQFDLTFDIYAMEPEELIALLPREFDRFKKQADSHVGAV